MSEYIGRRIVPVHGGVWDGSKTYEELTIVLYEASGDSYISRRPVPAGTVIGDKNYWMLFSLYSQQIADAVKEMRETDAAVRSELSAVESRMENRVTEAETLTNQSKSELNSRMDGIDKRLDANVSASTDADADFAAEVVDARVDSNGVNYKTLGASLRRNDTMMRSWVKTPITIPGNPSGENGNESRGILEKVMTNGQCYAVDLTLDYVPLEQSKGHFIRSYFSIPLSIFQKQYDGKKLVYQIYSSTNCDLYIAWGYLSSFKDGITLERVEHLEKGYNEFLLDCSTEEFHELAIPEDCSRFYFHYLFGCYKKLTNQPLEGTHHFRFSMYAREDTGKSLVGSDCAPQVAFAGASSYSGYSEDAGHAENADHSVDAVQSVEAQVSMNAGMLNAFKRMATRCKMPEIVADTVNKSVSVPIKKETELAYDAGFSIYIGTAEELRGFDIIVYKDEILPLTNMALNAGKSWGGGTYVDVQDLFINVGGNYWAAPFDDLLQLVIAKGRAPEDFNGDCYFMIYGNETWDLSQVSEDETFHNEYVVYKCSPESLIFDRNQAGLKKTVSELTALCQELREECEMLDSEKSAMQENLESLQKGNILWGKKWVACGDSFTEGDFSGYTDANGLSGKQSPELYDSIKKMYKTYPWWIGERNHMTVINEAKCGTIMSLDKSYVEDPENVAITTRNPFSLNRYKAIPDDADYITLWFGINDSSHTNLGTIEDTTNETFYGAWNVVLPYLIEHYPLAKIGIIITNRGNADYRKALREVALKWGIPYLDMMGDPQVPVLMYRENELALDKTAGDLRYNTFRVSASNGHPNLKAHEYQSTFIENFLRSL